jgi:SAM-dependent methyltransferase
MPEEPQDRAAREAERIRNEYARRARSDEPGYYSVRRPVNQFFRAQTIRACLAALDRHGLLPLTGKRILDVGCRQGNWLLEFLYWGAEPDMLAGIDLAVPEIEEARRRLPAADLHTGDAARLPFADASFDLVTQFVVFTSVLDQEVRRQIAAEMLRVVKPGGHILSYDFTVNNPNNPNVRRLAPGELASLFPGCAVDGRRVTLAPPLARRLVPLSWPLAVALESIPVLCTHYLAVLRTPTDRPPARAAVRT